MCHSYLLYYNVALQDYNSLEKPNKSQITHVDLDLEILDILKVIEEQNQVHVMTISQAYLGKIWGFSFSSESGVSDAKKTIDKILTL